MSDLFYSVIRFVPDPVREEVFNVGVVVVAEGRIEARFLKPQQLTRLRKLGYMEDAGFIRSLEREINETSIPHQQSLIEGSVHWSSSMLEEAARDWGGTVQFSMMRPASGVASRNAVDWYFDRFVAPPAAKHRAPDRKAIKAKVRRLLLRSVQSKYRRGKPERLVRIDDVVAGRFEEHQFDFTLRNSSLIQVVQTVSFDVGTKDSLAKYLDATKWALTDIREAHLKAPIAVVAMGDRQRELRDSAEVVIPKLGARFVAEDQLADWAEEVEASLPDRLT